MSVSVVINTLNESENLPRLLKSISGFADEVIVVDMESVDDTVKTAKKFGAKVFNYKQVGYVEPARNFAISKATSDWILILDADEKLSKTLRSKLIEIVKYPQADYYRLPRKNLVFGKYLQYSRWWPDYNIRFFRKGFVSWSDEIHSIPVTTGRGADLPAEESMAIVHHNYVSTDQYLSRMMRYTSIQSRHLIEEGYKFKWSDILSKPVGEFLSRYFQGQGYKDGLHGLALSILQGFSEFVVYLKVWEAIKFKEFDVGLGEVLEESSQLSGDYNYWKADSLLRENGGLRNRVKRRLKLS